MSLKPRHGISPVAVVAAIASGAAGAGVIMRGLDSGLVTRSGARIAALVVGAAICAIGACLFLRGIWLRRRARAEQLASLAVRRSGRFRFASGAPVMPDGGTDFENGYIYDLAAGDDPTDGLPSAPAEIRAATRALLVSLEEQLRGEGRRPRRPGRPACRRARLRLVGRSEPRRRRVRDRVLTLPS